MSTTPPYSFESEQGALAAMMYSEPAGEQIATILAESDFFESIHRQIFRAIRSMREFRQPVDFMTLHAKLEGQPGYPGISYLTGLDRYMPTLENAVEYAMTVKDRRIRRDIIGIAQAAEASARDFGESTDVLVDDVAGSLRKVKVADRSAPAFVNDLIDEAASKAMARREGVLTGVLTGYRAIDEMCPYGAEPGEVSVIAGWKRHGKSSLALGIAAHAAIALGKQVLYYSTEMNKYDLTYRLLSYWSAVPFRRIKLGELSWDDERKLARAREHIDARRSLSFEFGLGGIDKIARIAKSQQIHHGLDLLVVDFLQQLSRPGGRMTGEEQLSLMMRQTKEIAVDLGIPVWLLSQLSTPQEKKSKRIFRPHIDLLKGAGTIGDDAHVAIGVYQPWLDDPNNNDPSKGEIHFMKNKNGETGEVELYWDGPTMAYRDYSTNKEAF